MSNNKKINSPEEFHEKHGKVPNLLIGNGFRQSHPIVKHAYEYIPQPCKIKEYLDNHMESIKKPDLINCPEKFLKETRIAISQQIIEQYISWFYKEITKEEVSLDDLKFSELRKSYFEKCHSEYSCKNFLSGKTNERCIFTLNYDPIMYFEILNLLSEIKFADGFQGSDFLDQAYIIERLEEQTNKIKIYYPHGAWFIRAQGEGYEKKLSKFSFANKSDCVISHLYDDARPYIIFEGRWRVKKTLIEDNVYLKHCFDQLGKIEGNLLIFGCSFNNDDHIIEKLKSNSSINKIYIAHIFLHVI